MSQSMCYDECAFTSQFLFLVQLLSWLSQIGQAMHSLLSPSRKISSILFLRGMTLFATSTSLEYPFHGTFLLSSCSYFPFSVLLSRNQIFFSYVPT